MAGDQDDERWTRQFRRYMRDVDGTSAWSVVDDNKDYYVPDEKWSCSLPDELVLPPVLHSTDDEGETVPPSKLDRPIVVQIVKRSDRSWSVLIDGKESVRIDPNTQNPSDGRREIVRVSLPYCRVAQEVSTSYASDTVRSIFKQHNHPILVILRVEAGASSPVESRVNFVETFVSTNSYEDRIAMDTRVVSSKKINFSLPSSLYATAVSVPYPCTVSSSNRMFLMDGHSRNRISWLFDSNVNEVKVPVVDARLSGGRVEWQNRSVVSSLKDKFLEEFEKNTTSNAIKNEKPTVWVFGADESKTILDEFSELFEYLLTEQAIFARYGDDALQRSTTQIPPRRPEEIFKRGNQTGDAFSTLCNKYNSLNEKANGLLRALAAGCTFDTTSTVDVVGKIAMIVDEQQLESSSSSPSASIHQSIQVEIQDEERFLVFELTASEKKSCTAFTVSTDYQASTTRFHKSVFNFMKALPNRDSGGASASEQDRQGIFSYALSFVTRNRSGAIPSAVKAYMIENNESLDEEFVSTFSNAIRNSIVQLFKHVCKEQEKVDDALLKQLLPSSSENKMLRREIPQIVNFERMSSAQDQVWSPVVFKIVEKEQRRSSLDPLDRPVTTLEASNPESSIDREVTIPAQSSEHTLENVLRTQTTQIESRLSVEILERAMRSALGRVVGSILPDSDGYQKVSIDRTRCLGDALEACKKVVMQSVDDSTLKRLRKLHSDQTTSYRSEHELYLDTQYGRLVVEEMYTSLAPEFWKTSSSSIQIPSVSDWTSIPYSQMFSAIPPADVCTSCHFHVVSNNTNWLDQIRGLQARFVAEDENIPSAVQALAATADVYSLELMTRFQEQDAPTRGDVHVAFNAETNVRSLLRRCVSFLSQLVETSRSTFGDDLIFSCCTGGDCARLALRSLPCWSDYVDGVESIREASSCYYGTRRYASILVRLMVTLKHGVVYKLSMEEEQEMVVSIVKTLVRMLSNEKHLERVKSDVRGSSLTWLLLYETRRLSSDLEFGEEFGTASELLQQSIDEYRNNLFRDMRAPNSTSFSDDDAVEYVRSNTVDAAISLESSNDRTDSGYALKWEVGISWSAANRDEMRRFAHSLAQTVGARQRPLSSLPSQSIRSSSTSGRVLGGGSAVVSQIDAHARMKRRVQVILSLSTHLTGVHDWNASRVMRFCRPLYSSVFFKEAIDRAHARFETHVGSFCRHSMHPISNTFKKAPLLSRLASRTFPVSSYVSRPVHVAGLSSKGSLDSLIRDMTSMKVDSEKRTYYFPYGDDFSTTNVAGCVYSGVSECPVWTSNMLQVVRAMLDASLSSLPASFELVSRSASESHPLYIETRSDSSVIVVSYCRSSSPVTMSLRSCMFFVDRLRAALLCAYALRTEGDESIGVSIDVLQSQEEPFLESLFLTVVAASMAFVEVGNHFRFSMPLDRVENSLRKIESFCVHCLNLGVCCLPLCEVVFFCLK